MKIEAVENDIILKEVYSGVIIETDEGKKLHICLRDYGFEVKLDNGAWHMIESEEDFAPCKSEKNIPDTDMYKSPVYTNNHIPTINFVHPKTP